MLYLIHGMAIKKEIFIKIFFSILLGALSLTLLEGALRSGAVAYHYYQKKPISLAPNSKLNRSVILCIGESTTEWGLNEAYPTFLQNKIDSEFGKGKYLVINAGITGTDTQEILKNLERNIQTYKPQIVISMMGINDWWGIENENYFYSHFRIYKFLKILAANTRNWISGSPKTVVLNDKVNPVVDGEQVLLPNRADIEPKINSGIRNYNEKKYIDAVDDFKSIEMAQDLPSYFYYWLGRSYFATGQKDKAQYYFKIYEKSENTANGYLNLAIFFLDNSGQFDQTNLKNAKRYLDLALRSAPENGEILTRMGVWHMKNENQILAKVFFEKAGSLKNPSALTLLLLGRSYVAEKNMDKAIEVFKQGLQDQSVTGLLLWSELLQSLVRAKKFEEAKKYYALAVERYPDEKIFLARIQRLGIPGVKFNKWDQLTVKNQIQNFLIYPPTRENYEKFAEILQSNGIRHVAMQYPMRSAEELRVILKKYPETVFVDNQLSFERELKNHSYDELFMDRFAQDFGHFTPRGAELVANQVFDVLTKEHVFAGQP